MRRAWAYLLLAIFGFTPITPAIFAEDASSLPACCRRFGQHHCLMLLEDSGGPGLKGVCSDYAHVRAVAASPKGQEDSGLAESRVEFAPPAAHSSPLVQSYEQLAAEPDETLSGRGPPRPLL